MTTIVADTSVIINGNLAQQIESGSIRNSELVIPQAVFDELQSQASNNKQQGFAGLEQIEKLNQLSENSGVKILIKGSHPDINDIKFASSGRIDALIIDIAKQNEAVLYTSDKVQHLVAKAEDIQTVFLKPKIVFEELEFLKFFDNATMSIHLKENQFPLGKKGKPGEFQLSQINDCLLYTSPSPRDAHESRMPSSA